jgi:pyruvate carboxylase
MDRALREFRIRGVKTNIPFLENVIHNDTFKRGQASTTLIDTTPESVQVQAEARPRDQAAELTSPTSS